MAKSQSTPSTLSAPSESPQTDFARVPDGFRRLGSVTAECWFALKVGNSLRGKLLGLFDRADPRNKKTGRSEFFQVELLDPTECRYGKGEKATFKTAPVGTVVNLNCNTKSEVLKDLIADIKRHAEYEIFVRCNKKIDLNNGNTMWDMTVGEKLLKAPYASEEEDFDGGGDGEPDASDTQAAV